VTYPYTNRSRPNSNTTIIAPNQQFGVNELTLIDGQLLGLVTPQMPFWQITLAKVRHIRGQLRFKQYTTTLNFLPIGKKDSESKF